MGLDTLRPSISHTRIVFFYAVHCVPVSLTTSVFIVVRNILKYLCNLTSTAIVSPLARIYAS